MQEYRVQSTFLGSPPAAGIQFLQRRETYFLFQSDYTLVLSHLKCQTAVNSWKWSDYRGPSTANGTYVAELPLHESKRKPIFMESQDVLRWKGPTWPHTPVLDVVLCQNTCKISHIIWRAEGGKFTDPECVKFSANIEGEKQVAFRYVSIVLSTRWQGWKWR